MHPSESRKPSTPPSGPEAAMSDVRSATAPIATPARTGWLPVANPNTARTSSHPGRISARRREISDGPPEPAAAGQRREQRPAGLRQGRAEHAAEDQAADHVA